MNLWLYIQKEMVYQNQRKKTFEISVHAYACLLGCCGQYEKYLANRFCQICVDDFTCKEYLTFDNKKFVQRIKLKIPTLFLDDYEFIAAPNEYDDFDQYALLDVSVKFDGGTNNVIVNI